MKWQLLAEYFQMHFVEITNLLTLKENSYFGLNFIQVSNKQQVIIGSGNGLVPFSTKPLHESVMS